MEIHAPDSAYTSSLRAHANYRIAVRITLGFVALLWLIQLSGWALDVGPADLGVRPRQWTGLPGIVFAPLLHDGFAHLLANTPPLLVLGVAMLYLYPAAAPRVLPAIWLGPGIAVWLLGAAGTIHIGASGLVYGLLGYIFVAGLLRRDRRAIAASMLVCFMYGALVWGVLPIRTRTSWETHLAAALIGVGLALLFRGRDVPPRKRYTWEDEPAVVPEADDASPWDAPSASPPVPLRESDSRTLH
jgi:membrane associated rhomboid family serine protease